MKNFFKLALLMLCCQTSLAESPVGTDNNITCLKNLIEFSEHLTKHPQNNIKIPPDISFDAGRLVNDRMVLFPDHNVKNKWHLYIGDRVATPVTFNEDTNEIYVLRTKDEPSLIVRHNFKTSTNSFYKDSFEKRFEELELLDQGSSTSKDKIKSLGHQPVEINVAKRVEPDSLNLLYSEISERTKEVFKNFENPNASDMQRTVSKKKWKALHIAALKSCNNVASPEVQANLATELSKFGESKHNTQQAEKVTQDGGSK